MESKSKKRAVGSSADFRWLGMERFVRRTLLVFCRMKFAIAILRYLCHALLIAVSSRQARPSFGEMESF